jgi:hypothetical protein
MKFLSLLFLSILFLFWGDLQAQEEILLPHEVKAQSVRLPTTLLDDGERVPWVILPDVDVYG